MKDKKVVQVVAAMIWDGDKFLICQRPANKARGLLWEFVGGKVEPGETKQEALRRECLEELAISIEVGKVFMEVDHIYPDITIHLTLFHALILSGEIQKIEHNDYCWIQKAEVNQFDFCPADAEILELIKEIPSAGETYRHYKGNEYKVLNLAMDTAEPDLVVVYQDTNNNSKIWIRSYSDWISKVRKNSEDVVRFKKKENGI